MDRIDLHVEVPVLPFETLAAESTAENSETIRERILRCRQIQMQRQCGEGKLNAFMRSKELREFCRLPLTARQLMEAAVKELGFSARAYYKTLKIARTIADLEDSEWIAENHLAEALQYRSLDRQYV